MFHEALAPLQPLALWTTGLVVYGVFTYKFYQYLARRDVISLDLKRYSTHRFSWLRKLFASGLWLVEFAVLFPLTVFFWFATLAILLALLSERALVETALISMSLVAAVRVTSYFTEDLSRDLAKMIPFALLGVFLVDAGTVSIAQELAQLPALTTMLETLAYYLAYIVVLELALRVMHALGPAGDAPA